MTRNNLSFDSKLDVSDNLLIQEIQGGETIFLNLNTECYLSLDNVGTDFWHELTTQNSIKSAYDNLLNSYNVKPDELKKDLIDFINKLLENDLVNIVEK